VSAGRKPGFYALTLLHVGCFAIFYVALWQQSLQPYAETYRRLWWLKIALEIFASFYFFSVILKSWDYLVASGVSWSSDGPPDLRVAPGGKTRRQARRGQSRAVIHR
jgi:hypothetical protein